MSHLDKLKQLLRTIGYGKMAPTAYDTAWVARLTELEEPMGEDALAWLREHQLEDGSWGAAAPRYYHDRLVSTLAAVTALGRRGDPQDSPHIERARAILNIIISRLTDDFGFETIGFEMIVPTLMAEAEALGLANPPPDSVMRQIERKRRAKLARLPGGLISRHVTLAFSGEMAGADGVHLFNIPHLQEANGSLGHSPSASAYFALTVRRGDAAALNYLREVAQRDAGGIPNVAPFDNFERAWTLWNLWQTGLLDEEAQELARPHLDFLESAWRPGEGAGYAAGYTPVDADSGSVVYEVLKRYGRSPDTEAILAFEEDTHFRCFALESNPSLSGNIHVLGALRAAGLPPKHPSVQKIARFLSSEAYWYDKWHVSPYYPTAHAIIAGAGFLDALVEEAVNWLLATQRPEGAWGRFMATAEETAYALQALVAWQRAGHKVASETLERGRDWLLANESAPYPPLWIGKCLYQPVHVVRGAILSALAMLEA
jgi:halimadienyl-diphosphate synthase